MYVINPWWFYLIGIAEGIQTFFLLVGGIGLVLMLIVFINKIFGDEINFPIPIKKICIIFAIMIFIGALIPNKETCYSMAIASIVTTENLNYTAEVGENIVDYITEKAIELIEAGE